jgi:hypothetical protein
MNTPQWMMEASAPARRAKSVRHKRRSTDRLYFDLALVFAFVALMTSGLSELHLLLLP